MNAEKLAKMQSQVRIGGKGTARRKKKVVRRNTTTDDKKLQSSLKKISVSNISGIEEVNMIKDDGSVIHFNNPKVQASLNANTFAISGHAENKQITEMLPGILNHLGSEGFNQLKRLASSVNTTNVPSTALEDEDDDVPELVEDFEAASKSDTGAADDDIPPLVMANEDLKKTEADGKVSEKQKKPEESKKKTKGDEDSIKSEDKKKTEEKMLNGISNSEDFSNDLKAEAVTKMATPNLDAKQLNAETPGGSKFPTIDPALSKPPGLEKTEQIPFTKPDDMVSEYAPKGILLEGKEDVTVTPSVSEAAVRQSDIPLENKSTDACPDNKVSDGKPGAPVNTDSVNKVAHEASASCPLDDLGEKKSEKGKQNRHAKGKGKH